MGACGTISVVHILPRTRLCSSLLPQEALPPPLRSHSAVAERMDSIADRGLSDTTRLEPGHRQKFQRVSVILETRTLFELC